jgi:hypothetical protein
MNFKFQVGELVKVNDSLALVIGRRAVRRAAYGERCEGELYTLLLPGGERVSAIPHSLTKVNK